MRRRRVAAGVAAAAAGAVVVARTTRSAPERVEIRYDDGATVCLDRSSAAREALLAPARQAIEAVRT